MNRSYAISPIIPTAENCGPHLYVPPRGTADDTADKHAIFAQYKRDLATALGCRHYHHDAISMTVSGYLKEEGYDDVSGIVARYLQTKGYDPQSAHEPPPVRFHCLNARVTVRKAHRRLASQGLQMPTIEQFMDYFVVHPRPLPDLLGYTPPDDGRYKFPPLIALLTDQEEFPAIWMQSSCWWGMNRYLFHGNKYNELHKHTRFMVC